MNSDPLLHAAECVLITHTGRPAIGGSTRVQDPTTPPHEHHLVHVLKGGNAGWTHLSDAVEGGGEAGVAEGLDAGERLPQRQQRDRRHAHQPVGLQVAHVDVEVRAACNDV